MENVRTAPSAFKRARIPTFPHGIPTPTRGDLLECLAGMLQAWNEAANPVAFMEAAAPHIKQARQYVDAADAQRLESEL